jgi:hypothetical protein
MKMPHIAAHRLRKLLLHIPARLRTGTAQTIGVDRGGMRRMTAGVVGVVEAGQKNSEDRGAKKRGVMLAECHQTMGHRRWLAGRDGMTMGDRLRLMSRRGDAVDGRISAACTSGSVGLDA